MAQGRDQNRQGLKHGQTGLFKAITDNLDKEPNKITKSSGQMCK